MSFLIFDAADDIITILEIIEKLIFPETDFWHDTTLGKLIYIFMIYTYEHCEKSHVRETFFLGHMEFTVSLYCQKCVILQYNYKLARKH